MPINPNEFQYMHRGKVVGPLPVDEIQLLTPIHREGLQKHKALLLLHGFSSSPAVYRQLLPSLTMYDTIVCPVLPGHGDSIAAFSVVGAHDWMACAEQACEQLINRYEAVDVMGLSLGGLLASHLSQRFKLHHLFLLAPALSLCMNVPLTLFGARFLYKLGLRRIPNKAGNIYTEKYAELAYKQISVHAIIEILSWIQRFQWMPPTCPTDVLLGRHDEVVNSHKVAERFADLTNVSIHWLENSAHVLPLDGDIDQIIACLNKASEC